MEDKKIGVHALEVKEGDIVFYYPWYNKENGNHAEGIETKLTSEVYYDKNNNRYVCNIEGIRGHVMITHLSKNYYPEHYVEVTKAEQNYKDYLHADGVDGFHEWLGITPPKIHIDRNGNYSYQSVKYNNVKGEYFKFKKEAKADYKIKLREYLKKNKKKKW